MISDKDLYEETGGWSRHRERQIRSIIDESNEKFIKIDIEEIR